MKKRIMAMVIALLMAASALPMSDIAEFVPDISVKATADDETEVGVGKQASIMLDNGKSAYFTATFYPNNVLIEPKNPDNDEQAELFYDSGNIKITSAKMEKIRTAAAQVLGAPPSAITLTNIVSDEKKNSMKKKLKTKINNVDLSGAYTTDKDCYIAYLGDDIFNGFTSLQTVKLNSNIRSIGKNAFNGCSMFIGEGAQGIDLSNVMSIGESAFSGCPILEKVKLGNGLTEIPSKAFNNCKKLAEINIPSEVTRIGESAFAGDVALRKVTFYTKHSLVIFKKAFSGCSALANINYVDNKNVTINNTLPPLLAQAGNGCFENCKSLNTLKIGSMLTYLPPNMFSGCSGLKTLKFTDLNNSFLEWVGQNAFNGCTELTELIFPKSEDFKGFCSSVFSGCSKLKKVIVPDNTKYLGGKAEIDKDDEDKERFIYTPFEQYYDPEDPDKKLDTGGNLFYNCKQLSFAGWSNKDVLSDNQVLIPSGVVYIPTFTFRNCSGLTLMDLTDYIGDDIGDSAFEGCTSLKKVSLPNSVKRIRTKLFYNCSSLVEVIYSNELEEIEDSAFEGCKLLYKVYPRGQKGIDGAIIFPKTLVSLGKNAFRNCESFKYLNILGGDKAALTALSGNAFENCKKFEGATKDGTSSEEISFPEGIHVTGEYVFRGCTNLKKIRFTGDLNVINKGLFQNCTSLETVVVNPTITQIMESAFENCSSLKKAPVTEKGKSGISQLTVVNDKAFNKCTSITEIDISDCKDLMSIGKNSFSGCTNLAAVYLPQDASLGTIGDSAFQGCTKLKVITANKNDRINSLFPNTIWEIGTSAFSSTALKSITIVKPTKTDNKTTIGASAFARCEKLTSADLSKSTLVHLSDSTFSDDAELTTLALPAATLNSIGKSALSGCTKLSTINSKTKGKAVIPASVKSIGDSAFKDNVCISKYVLSENTDTISLSAFDISRMPSADDIEKGNADPLKEFDVDENNPNFMSINGVLYDKDPDDYQPKTLLIYPMMKEDETLEIPDTVEQIRSKAVSNNTNLKNVTINKDLENINDNAFFNCTGLTKVEFGTNKNVKFAKTAFSGLTGKPKVGFYAAKGSTAEKYAQANENTIQFYDNNMKAATISIDQGESVVYPKSTRFDLTVTLKTASGQKTNDMLSWSSSNINVVSVDNEGHCTTKNIDGSSTLTVITEGGLKATIVVSVGKKTITDQMVTLSQTSFTYDGKEKKPTVTVKDGTSTLRSGTDYTVAYSANTNVGTATVTVTGNGVYRGSIQKTFKIAAKPITNMALSISPESFVYSGAARKPAVTLKDGAKVLTLGTDYTVTYANNTNVGTATLKVTGRGNYSSSVSRTFAITAKSIAGATVTVEPSSYTYDGKAKTPKVTVMDGKKVLVNGTDYTLTYKNNTAVGTASVIVYGKGNYNKNTFASATFNINKISLKNAAVTLAATSYSYDGTAKKPAVTVKSGEQILKNGVDYTVTYSNNVNPGTATVTVTGAGKYGGSVSKTFTIAETRAKPINAASVSLSQTAYSYDGTAKRPVVTVKDAQKVLKANTDYTVVYTNNTKAGTATVTVTGAGKYGGNVVKNFTIKAKSVAGAAVSLSQTAYSYDGSAKKPVVTVKDGKKVLKANTDYTVAYTNNTNAGTATVTVTGKGNYDQSVAKTFTIKAKSITGAAVSLSQTAYSYDGSAKKPVVTVKDGKKVLKANTDYTVAYTNNTNAGTATVTVTGKGNYAQSVTRSFTIKAKSITGAAVTFTPASMVYTGTALRPTVTVSDGKKVLKANTDYTVTYTKNTNVGTATFTVTGKGNYNQSVKKTFRITAKPIADLKFTLSQTKFNYDGKEKTPKVTITDGKKQLKEGTDYTISYSNNVEGSKKAAVTVTAKGNYKGKKTLLFTINDNEKSLFRLQGSRREFTATAISAKCYDQADTVIVTTGYDFHDALISVPLATAYDAPILLVHMNVLHDDVKDEIVRLGAKNIIVVNTTGTQYTISKAVIDQLRELGKVSQISTGSYIKTAEKVAENLRTRIKTNTNGSTSAPKEVFFVTNAAYADALSASPVAAIKGAPIIYVDPKAKDLDSAVKSYLSTIKGSVTKAYIIGGTVAMPTTVEKKIQQALPGSRVIRFAGARRYETCIMINEYFTNTDKVLTSRSLCVAKGLDFPDALAGGVFAAARKAPVFLVDPVVNPDSKKAQIEYLKKKKANKIIVFGGPVAVPDQVVNFVKNTK